MKIQLKRSNVLDGGAAKEPTASQMEYGELAVNYNTDDPAIFLKDSNNNIIRISGVNNIADDGQVEVPSSIAPPSDPLPGNLWFNPVDGRLYVYYDDGNSQQWVDASPDSWNPSVIPDPDGGDNQPGTLDDRYVNKTGDNMTGDLTLGTDKITLNATDGSGVFKGLVQAANGYEAGGVTLGGPVNGYIFVRNDKATPSTAIGVFKNGNLTEDLTASVTNDGSIFAAGDVKIGGTLPSAPNITLSANGSATFKDVVSVSLTSDPNTWSNVNGNGVICQNPVSNSSNVFFRGRTGSNDNKVSIFTNGSATFAGSLDSGNRLKVGDMGVTPRTAAALLAYDDLGRGGSSVSIFCGGTAYFREYLGIGGSTAGVNEPTKTENIQLNGSDVSATFIGNVTSIGSNYISVGSDSSFTTHASIYSNGRVIARGDSTSVIDYVFAGQDSGITKSKIYTDGGAMFKGAVQTAGGVVTPSMVLQLETDNPANYTTTTDGEGVETQVYNGPVLDVKALLLTLQTAASRIEALEAEVQALKDAA